MTVIIRASDTAEQLEKKMARAMKAHRKQLLSKAFDPLKFLGKLKDVYGDGLEYQRKLRDEWS
jgi:DnaJ-domain-containing protein 1